MGKSLNPLSVTEGKIGNVVYFKLKNSSDGQRQGAREYVANPSNPRTDSQIGQRCKMTTVTNCYRAFKNVIQRSFEGTEYGAKSYQRWASMAMGQQFGGPWLLKGDRRPCPVLGVPMSIGSLPSVSVVAATNDLETSLVCNSQWEDSSVAELSTALLTGNNWLQEGDQITICAISGGTLEQNLYFGGSYSFYLNTNDVTPVQTFIGLALGTSNSKMTIINDTWTPLAACVIISREGSHLRSTSYWGYSHDFERAYVLDGDTSVLPSYKGSQQNRATDWPVDPGASPTPTEFNTQTASGTSVTLYSLRVDGEYLVASAKAMGTGQSLGEVYFFCNDVRSAHYNKWLTSFNTDSSTAPDGVTSADTINYKVGSDATRHEILLLNWLIANGVDERWIYTGE